MMKKISYLLFASAFSVMAALPIVFGGNVSISKADENLVEIASISSLIEVAQKVNSGDDSYAGKTLKLTENIDLTRDWTPIGNFNNPFKGTFEGDGHIISGIKISDAKLTEQGLFGATDGAKISNLKISGAVEFAASEVAVYAGAIVGRASNTTISGCELESETVNNINISFGSTIGGFVGLMENGGRIDTSVSYTPINVTYNLAAPYTVTVGGAVGKAENTKFEKIGVYRNVSLRRDIISQTPQGSTITSGGLIGSIDGNLTQIRDCVFGAEISSRNFSGQDILKTGILIGNVFNEPDIKNMESIAYIPSKDVSKFGVNIGTTYNFITEVDPKVSVYVKEFYQSPSTSFDDGTSFKWSDYTPNWDFDNMWVMTIANGKSEIHLQKFQNFSLDLANLLDGNALLKEISSPDTGTTFSYGEQVEMKVAFDEEKGIDNYRYYKITDILLSNANGTAQRLNISLWNKTENGVISPDGTISFTQDPNTKEFTLLVTASNVTKGNYSFALTAVEYTANIIAQNNGSVRYSGGQTTNAISRKMTKASSPIKIEAVANKQYAFANWSLYYLREGEKLDGDVEYDGKIWMPTGKTYRDNPLEIKFGEKDFTNDFLLIAEFRNDPCTLTFNFDNTIVSKIDVNGQIVTKTNESVLLDKNENVTIKIFVIKGYEAAVDDISSSIKAMFARENASLKVEKPYADPENADISVYEFIFSTSSLDYSNFSQFNIFAKTQTAVVEDNNNQMMWIIIGSSVGGVLLIGGLVLFFVLRRRRKAIANVKNRDDDYKKYYY